MSATPNTILLVDPDPHARALLVQQLRSVDCTIVEAGDAAAALGVLSQGQVRLLVTELYLPVGDIKCLVRAVREQDAYRDTKVAVHTHRSLAADREWALLVGADAYLIKPTRAQRVRYVVGRLLASRTSPGAPRRGGENGADGEVPMRRDSLDDALQEIERGSMKAKAVVFGREWWTKLAPAQRASYRQRARAARVSLRSDSHLRNHFVEVRGRFHGDLGVSTERPESPYRR